MLHFLELPKINKKNNFASNLERWLTFLKAEGREPEGQAHTTCCQKAHNVIYYVYEAVRLG